MTMLHVSLVAAAGLAALALARVAAEAARPKPVPVVATVPNRARRLATFLVALAVPAFGAAIAYFSA